MNLVTTCGVSNAFIDALFTLLKVDLFPKDNNLPKSLYHAKKAVKRLGLSYNNIHACYNGCVQFKRELNTATTCPKCKMLRLLKGPILFHVRYFVISH
jgi:predicted Zn-ribbon and HTH transcriptional regulator